MTEDQLIALIAAILIGNVGIAGTEILEHDDIKEAVSTARQIVAEVRK